MTQSRLNGGTAITTVFCRSCAGESLDHTIGPDYANVVLIRLTEINRSIATESQSRGGSVKLRICRDTSIAPKSSNSHHSRDISRRQVPQRRRKKQKFRISIRAVPAEFDGSDSIIARRSDEDDLRVSPRLRRNGCAVERQSSSSEPRAGECDLRAAGNRSLRRADGGNRCRRRRCREFLSRASGKYKYCECR